MFCVNFFHLKWEGKVYKMNFYLLWTEANTSFIMILFLLRYKGAEGILLKNIHTARSPFCKHI